MTFKLSQLDGVDGFRLVGDTNGNDVAGAGDINGDGIDDLIVGAWRSVGGYYGQVGGSYVVFGSGCGFGATVDLTALSGSDGFHITFTRYAYGYTYDYGSGNTVSGAGDINGDGVDDLIIGDRDERVRGFGDAHVVFGSRDGFGASLELSSLDGANGFSVNTDYADSVASAGDMNGDGIADLVVGDSSYSGRSHVVFGSREGFPASVDTYSLDGADGFRFVGQDYDSVGRSVEGAGDINGDGYDDLVIGAPGAGGPYGYYGPGVSYVVFGSPGDFPASFDAAALDGTNGFSIPAAEHFDQMGASVAGAGDVNGDGLDDLIVAVRNYGYGGAAYVIFGTTSGFAASFDLSSLDGTNGFRITGQGAPGLDVGSVAAAGDVNGDGVDDLIVQGSGTHVLFGSRTPFAASIDITSIDGRNGVGIAGADVTAAAGDVNHDGIDDLIVGDSMSGTSSVVFGSTQLGGRNDAPTAGDDAVSARALDVVDLAADHGGGSDRDPDFDTLTITGIDGIPILAGDSVVLSSGLRVTLVQDAEVRFDLPGAPIGSTASDSFSYTISDGRCGSATATVAVDFVQDALALGALDGTTGFVAGAGSPFDADDGLAFRFGDGGTKQPACFDGLDVAGFRWHTPVADGTDGDQAVVSMEAGTDLSPAVLPGAGPPLPEDLLLT